MTHIVAVSHLRYLASGDRSTWRVELACGSTYTIDRWGKDRPVVGEAVTCSCATCTRPAETAEVAKV